MIVTVQFILVSLGIFFRLKAHKFVHFKYISSSTGFRYWMKEFKQQTNGQTTSFHIVFPIKNKISFRIEPLGLGTALLLKMGLTNRFKTGDAEFDESFFRRFRPAITLKKS